jgi:hypothetical protein
MAVLSLSGMALCNTITTAMAADNSKIWVTRNGHFNAVGLYVVVSGIFNRRRLSFGWSPLATMIQ